MDQGFQLSRQAQLGIALLFSGQRYQSGTRIPSCLKSNTAANVYKQASHNLQLLRLHEQHEHGMPESKRLLHDCITVACKTGAHCPRDLVEWQIVLVSNAAFQVEDGC